MVRKRWLLFAVCLLASGACGGGDNEGIADSIVYVASDDVGDDPFTADLATEVPAELGDIREDLVAAAESAEASLGSAGGGSDAAEIKKVRLDAVTTVAEQNGLSVIAPASPIGVGIYGGSGVNACDVEGLIAFLTANESEGRAWAAVQGIDVSEIEEYTRSLTPGFLVDDTEVLNHSFANDEAVPLLSVLQAGTAVLVDDEGIPRVRCKCGNPLAPGLLELDGRTYGASQWADRIVDSAQAADNIIEVFSAPEAVIGIPDWDASAESGSFSLGGSDGPDCNGFVIVEFVDNRLFNGPGNDLRVVEIGPAVEATHVAVREDGNSDWIELGRVDGGTSEIDLGVNIESSVQFSQVRICERPDAGAESGRSAGPDIDAVGAINSLAVG